MLHISSLYASILALLIICLGARVAFLRMRHRVGVLDGGNPDLLKAIRVHGNAAEWVPLTLILFACAESMSMPAIHLHMLGNCLLLSRLLHAYGLSRTRGASFGRFSGVVGTWTVMILLCVYNLYHYLHP